MYEHAPAAAGHRRPNRGSGRQSRQTVHSEPERTLFLQLLVCVVLFLVLFIGKGVFPARLVQAREQLTTLLISDTDFRSAFSRLGESLDGGGALFDRLEGFCAEAFGIGGVEGDAPPAEPAPAPEPANLMAEEEQFFTRNPDRQALTDHYLRSEITHATLRIPVREIMPAEPGPSPAEVEAASVPQEPAIPAAGTLLAHSDYSGDTPPANYTMDKLSLGALETMTPVMGRINSEYGYRDHPIDGRYHFHGGVDISGAAGDPIHAFAAGTVEYVGKDDSYGLYLQLDHGSGVKSFYAHCSKILVQKGQAVSIGEKIAEIGSTGSATGPHLHLELKYEKMHLNPIYYIEYTGKA